MVAVWRDEPAAHDTHQKKNKKKKQNATNNNTTKHNIILINNIIFFLININMLLLIQCFFINMRNLFFEAETKDHNLVIRVLEA